MLYLITSRNIPNILRDDESVEHVREWLKMGMVDESLVLGAKIEPATLQSITDICNKSQAGGCILSPSVDF